MSDVKNYKKFRGGIRLETQGSDPDTNLEEGAIVYNSTEKSLKVHNGSGFAAVGGGAGGSLDTFHTEDFTTLQTSSINETSGKYSLEILNAGISKKTLKVTIDNSCTTGDKIVFPVIDLNARQKGQTCSISFYYYTEDEGGGTPYDEKIDVIVATDSGLTNPILVSSLKDSSSIKKFVDTFTVPSNVNNLYYGFKCNATLPNGVFYIDDIEFSQDPFVQADLGTITSWETYEPATTSTSGGSGALHEGRWRRVGDSMEVVFELLLGNSGVGSDPAVVGLPTSVASSPWKNDYEVDPILTPSKKRIIGKFWIAQGDNANLAGVEGVTTESNATHSHTITRNYVITFNSAYPGFVQLADQSVGGGSPNTELEICNWDSFEGNLGPSDKIYGKFTVPIKGWGSTNTHIVTPNESVQPAMRQMASGGTLAHPLTAFMCFTTEITDSDDLFSGTSTGFQSDLANATYYTCPMDGVYQVDMGIKLGSEDIAGKTPAYAVYLRRYNSSDVQQEEICLIEKIDLGSGINVTVIETAVRSLNCSKGDKLTLSLMNNCGATCERITNDQNWFHVTKIHHKPQLSAIPYTKWQRKHLAQDVTTEALLHNTTGNGDFIFQYLTEGTYRLSGQFKIRNDANSGGQGASFIEIKKGPSVNLFVVKTSIEGGEASTYSFNEMFTLTAADIAAGRNSVQFETKDMRTSTDDILYLGDQNTFCILEKLSMHEEVEIW